jgi:hypothetical protein
LVTAAGEPAICGGNTAILTAAHGGHAPAFTFDSSQRLSAR